MISDKTTLFALLISSFAHIIIFADGKYWQEFEALKNNPSYAIVFDRDVSPLAQSVAKSIENIKKADALTRVVRPIIGMTGGIIVDEKTMPLLHEYVDTLCKQHGMSTPIIAVTPHEGLFNAMTEKFFKSSGTIVVGRDLLKECSEEEIEGVIAHELGHIKHNHINKLLMIDAVRIAALYQLYKYNILSGLSCLFLQLVVPYVAVGKKLEWQADNFACKNARKAKELICFFERLQSKEMKPYAEFDKVAAMLTEDDTLNKDALDEAWLTLKFAKMFYSFLIWLQYKTPFGTHPSPVERIENAKRIIEQQE